MKILSLPVALLLLRATAAAGQTPVQPPGCGGVASTDAFVACARSGTEQYRDHAKAVLDGYRRVGGDFPGMGEHWIRTALLFDGAIEPARPEVLTYVSVGGAPQLLGVAYVVPLLEGEQPPDGPIGRHAWHDHSRTLDDETVLPKHHTSDAGAGARLTMLHAWIWSPNPGGMFAADNWAIPAIRLGLPAPLNQPEPVAKALSFAVGGRGYIERAIDAAAQPTARERRRVGAALDRAEAAVTAVARDLTSQGLDAARGEALGAIWAELWRSVDAALSAQARARLAERPLR